MDVEYLQLIPERNLPEWRLPGPFRAVLIAEAAVTPAWQDTVSEWLVGAGCLYMLAWGKNCSSWDDAVDYANCKAFAFMDIPPDKFVMTTWHDGKPLSEVFRAAKTIAHHPVVEVARTVLIHVSPVDQSAHLLDAYANA